MAQDLVDAVAEAAFCSAVLADPDALAEQSIIWTPQDFRGPETAEIAQAIFDCLHPDDPKDRCRPTRPNVLAALQRRGVLNSVVKPTSVRRLDDQGTSDVIADLAIFARRIRSLGVARRNQAAALAYARDVAAAPDEADALTNGLTSQLHRNLSAAADGEDDGSIQRALTTPRQEAAAKFSTGLTWLDGLFDGFVPSEVIGVKGAQKKRKTTLAAYMVLSAALKGARVMWATTADGTWLRVHDRFIVLLAVAWMRSNQIPEEHWRLKPKYPYANFRTAYQRDALAYATERLRREGDIHAFDPKTHRINHVDELERIARRLHNHQPLDILVVDYLQAGVVPGLRDDSDYAVLRGMTRRLLQLNHELGCSSVWLLQQNEAQNAGKGGGGAGIRGGGAALDAVDVLLSTEYSKRLPDQLGVEVWAARYAGGETSHVYRIEPVSGFVRNARSSPGGAEYLEVPPHGEAPRALAAPHPALAAVGEAEEEGEDED